MKHANDEIEEKVQQMNETIRIERRLSRCRWFSSSIEPSTPSGG